MLGVGAALIGAGGSLAGGLLANNANKRQAQRQMDFQREMSNTAHQREVQDLIAAGLNPVLSANGGASAGQGASAEIRDIASPAISNALEVKRLDKDIKEADSRILLNNAQEKAAKASEDLNRANATQVGAQTTILEKTLPAIIEKAKYETGQYKYNQKFLDYDNISDRIFKGAAGASNFKDLINPFSKPKWQGTGKDGTIYHKGTGEIIRP